MFLVKREHRKLKDADIKKMVEAFKENHLAKYFLSLKDFAENNFIICHFKTILKGLQVATDNVLFFD